MDLATVLRLGVMMFLQFFVWGAWYVTAPNYLGTIGFDAGDFAWTYSVGPIAGMVTPLFVGLIADRYFAAQRVLGVLHIAGGLIMLASTTLMRATAPEPSLINVVFLGYMLTYFPTLALTNTVAMRNMTNSEKEFPYVRVFGTIGWIAAGWTLTGMGIDTKVTMFQLAGSAAVLLGLYSFTLPNTPPTPGPKVSAGELFGLDALKLLRDRSYLIFMIASVLVCIPLAFYYQITSRVVEMVQLPPGRTMAWGQVSEIFFMLVMPLFFARLGVKWMLAVGMLAWVVRYTLFAFGAQAQAQTMIIMGVLLHGICYDFFFVTGQIYTDNKAPQPMRAQAQGLLVMLTLGLGMLIGAQSAGLIEKRFTTEESKGFAEQVKQKTTAIEDLNKQIPQADASRRATLEAEIASLEAEQKQLRQAELSAIDWKPLWLIPAGFAAAVLVAFVLLFRDSGSPTHVDPTQLPPTTAAEKLA